MQDCIFCKIAEGSVPAKKVYENDHVLAFDDLSPQAPVHVLIIPKAHAQSLMEADALPGETLAQLLRAAAEVAAIKGVDKSGFRIISNSGPDACQSVGHLHIHLLGGEKLPDKMV